ncbi:hypothetical protein G210_3501 [Candida maltosa Xu316]|uniref:Uncharacterized protein n=1 Tax=Candida maltosa (strain Xu316) TaxID=1245528 RepID=M3HG72_CANMX|nr:hypothetical protein G210_3501 [Candida maltosa Xu316]
MYLQDENYVNLDKRDSRYGIGTAFIIIGFVVIVIIILSRSKKGFLTRQPTTRPQQQQQQQLQPEPRNNTIELHNQSENLEDYVPQYTATANENDLGFYDAEGKFHHVEKILDPPPPIHIKET